MANRTFNQTQGLLLLKRVVRLYPVISVPGGTGAITLQKRTFTAAGASSVAPSQSLAAAPTTGVDYAVGDAAGTRSAARTGVGAWTLTLSDPYQYIIGVSMVQAANATALLSTNAALYPAVDTTNSAITTNTARGNGGLLKIIWNTSSGVAGDFTNAALITLEVILGDATEP
jgi:hypothetical protein